VVTKKALLIASRRSNIMSSSRAPTSHTNYPSLRNRGISAPPRLGQSQGNAFTEYPQSNQCGSDVRIGPALRPDEAPTPRGTIVVYTDASCHGNYSSGVGIYFGEGHELNLSQQLPGPIHSSVFAELQAAQIALERLHAWKGYGGQLVILRSDCKAIVDSLRSGRFNDNRYTEQLIKLRMAAERFPNGVQFEHIYGHNGHPGNEMADRLATQATENSNRRGRSMSMNRQRSRSRSASRTGRGHPNSTVIVRPKAIDASLAIPSVDQSLCNSTKCQGSKSDASKSEVSRGRSRSIKPGKSQSQSTNLQTQSRGSKSCASSQVSSHGNSCASKPVSQNQSLVTKSEVPNSQNASMHGPNVSKSLPSQSRSASTNQSMTRGASRSMSRH